MHSTTAPIRTYLIAITMIAILVLAALIISLINKSITIAGVQYQSVSADPVFSSTNFCIENLYTAPCYTRIGLLQISGSSATYYRTAVLAKTLNQQMRGLMSADQSSLNFYIADGHNLSVYSAIGMLFEYDNQTSLCFWMKDTAMPLTQIWIDQNNTVTYVYNATPLSEQPVCHMGKYVLEVPQNSSSIISLGDRISLASA